jgi:hypothetical protein
MKKIFVIILTLITLSMSGAGQGKVYLFSYFEGNGEDGRMDRTWEDISDRITFPAGPKQGTIIEVKKSVLDKLLSFQNAK